MNGQMNDPEKRTLVRRKALRRARLVLNKMGGLGVDARVVNLSSRGARLRFDAPFNAPPELELLLLPENVRVFGRRVWQSDCDVGVEFDSPVEWLAKNDVPT